MIVVLTFYLVLGNIFFKINSCHDGKEYLDTSIKANLGWWKLGYRTRRKGVPEQSCAEMHI